MNKFLKNLSNTDNQLLSRRAESINTRAKMTQESLINNIKLEIENKKLQYQDLVDLGPETTDSLKPASSNWNPQNWVNQLQLIKQDIFDLNIQLKLAYETYKELFTEEEETVDTEKA